MDNDISNGKDKKVTSPETVDAVLAGRVFTVEELEKNGIEFLMYTGLFYIYKKDNKRFLINKLEDGSMKVFQEYFV